MPALSKFERAVRLANRVKREFYFSAEWHGFGRFNVMPFLKSAKPFEKLDEPTREYLLTQIKDPHTEECNADPREEIARYIYAKGSIPLDKLPSSYYENLIQAFIKQVDARRLDSETSYYMKEILEIIDLQKQIARHGYDRTKPIIVLGIFDREESRVAVDNGHHRLQALRNHGKSGKISMHYRVPIIMRFLKEIHGYQKVNFSDLIDYHFDLDELIATNSKLSGQGERVILFDFKNRGFLYIYIERNDNVLIIRPALVMPDAKNRLRTAVRFIKKMNPTLRIVARAQLSHDIKILKSLQDEGLFEAIVEKKMS